MGKKIERIGETKVNNFGSKMIITEYRNTLDMDVYFVDYGWTRTKVQYSNFKKGDVSCPYEKRVLGVGYFGEGEYVALINGNKTKEYIDWYHMLERCYDAKCLKKRPTYTKCDVCEDWLNFQNFGNWHTENYYQIENEVMCLDKDILFKGNKIYSSSTCVFVPQSINNLFIKSDSSRGKFPLGVYFNKSANKFVACLSITGKQKYLGCYDNCADAFNVYKNAKEEEVKRLANKYKSKIPKKLYDAMMTYVVEESD